MSADASSAASGSSSDAINDDEVVQELSHEEFDPYGTLAVTGLYFLLLLVLYALMYFVEFATRPSIIG
jgi:hypothetical protein